ncbi:GDSL-type esterase/lipase family protein [Sphingomonas sp. CD22]|uniref:GDSL-type esterase/lipase family protein n=1 Tax=Sphingomonas sp. CD22 TaxID=3100214 RepID=UPI002ADFD6BA|nr:GDSL-type esterase/lipase family protein [Sphingomonas sp. CD22]MEA1084031.1 GDSL-type esterase/lipase family protein [Sphingomonas sp. CD22]
MIPSPVSAEPLLLAYGDSLIAGYGLAAADAFPARLEQALRSDWPDAAVIAAGRSGDTSQDALARLPRTLAGLSHRPDLAIVQIGANDVLLGIAPARMRANLDAMLTEFARCGIAVLMTTIEPPAVFAERTRGYAGIHAAVAEQHGAATCAFFPAGVLGHPAMTLADRIHPNARAIGLVVDQVAPAVTAALRSALRAAA